MAEANGAAIHNPCAARTADTRSLIFGLWPLFALGLEIPSFIATVANERQQRPNIKVRRPKIEDRFRRCHPPRRGTLAANGRVQTLASLRQSNRDRILH